MSWQFISHRVFFLTVINALGNKTFADWWNKGNLCALPNFEAQTLSLICSVCTWKYTQQQLQKTRLKTLFQPPRRRENWQNWHKLNNFHFWKLLIIILKTTLVNYGLLSLSIIKIGSQDLSNSLRNSGLSNILSNCLGNT